MNFRGILEKLQKIMILTHRIQIAMVQFFDLKQSNTQKYPMIGQLELPITDEHTVIAKETNNMLRYLETTRSMLNEIKLLIDMTLEQVVNLDFKVRQSKKSHIYLDTTI